MKLAAGCITKCPDNNVPFKHILIPQIEFKIEINLLPNLGTTPMQDYKEFLAEILIDEESLKKRTAELGAQISADYPDGNLLLICILRGGVPFLVDLSRKITSPHAMDFMAVSSYGI